MKIKLGWIAQRRENSRQVFNLSHWPCLSFFGFDLGKIDKELLKLTHSAIKDVEITPEHIEQYIAAAKISIFWYRMHWDSATRDVLSYCKIHGE